MTEDPAAELNAAVAEAKAAWPRVRVDAREFAVWLSALGREGPPPLQRAADLYLAFGCIQEDAAALAGIDALVAAEVPRALTPFRQPAVFQDEIRQQVLAKLLVAPKGQRPKIHDYAGRGPLSAWIRSAAARTALNALDRRGVNVSLDEQAPAARGGADPELEHLQRRYRGPLKAAVEAVLRALPAEDRNVLRFHFVEGLSVEQIAVMRKEHRTTVWRLISRVRKAVLGGVQARFRDEFRGGKDELSSVLRLVQSQLDVSMERVLAQSRGPK
jgi:RNA polymerase sigma-70 factor (ECF subfamily)